jgi:hypothetical protein
MRLPRVIVACIVLFISSGVVSQQSMQSLVNSGTGEQKMQRLIAMGVESNAAETVAISSEPQLQWLSLQTESNKQLAVLFIPCSGDLAFAYLMRHVGNEWRAVDHDSFDCHYDDSVSLEVATLANKHAQDVLVHHACVSHGTGFVQQDFQVLTVRDGKFKSVLDTEEIVNSANDDLDEYQQSSFVILPSPEGRAIEETRSTTLNGKLTVERRYFRWLPSKDAYRASRFERVSVPSP